MADKVTSTEVTVVKKEVPAVVADVNVVVAKPDVKVAESESPEVIALKKQLSDAEENAKAERVKRIEAEKSRDESNTKVVSSQSEAVRAHEASINSQLEVATGNVAQIKRDLREAMEGGDLEKQLELQEKLSDARWTYRDIEKNKKQFETWKEQQKTAAPATANAQTPKYTATEQAWIDKHPRFNTDDDYYGVVAGADAAARRKGIQPDTKAYYEYVDAALAKSGLDETAQEDDNGRDNTGSEQEEEVVVAPKKVAKAAVAAPVTNTAPSSNREKSSRQFKLTPEMQDMARRTYGPNSMWKLSDKDAEVKYAERQMEIRDRRAAGEKV